MPTDNNDEVACNDCDVLFERVDLCESDYDGYLRCDGCHEEHISDLEDEESQRDGYDGTDGIHYHDWNPPRFMYHHDNGRSSSYYEVVDERPVLYFGPELEVESERCDRTEGIDVVQRHNEGLLYLKEDGSINHGFEIVGHPMSLGYVQNHADQLWRTMDGLRRIGFRAWQTSTCGLHIHMSKNAFHNDAHQQKFLYFMYNENNKPMLVRFAGRNSHWSKFRKDLYLGYDGSDSDGNDVTLLEAIKGRRKDGTRVNTSWDRYLAVNSRNQHTHELRFFRPSLQPHALRACIEFCAALFDYTASVTASDCINRRAMEFDKFAEFAQANKSKYPDFVPRLNKRVYNISPVSVYAVNPSDDGGFGDVRDDGTA